MHIIAKSNISLHLTVLSETDDQQTNKFITYLHNWN